MSEPGWLPSVGSCAWVAEDSRRSAIVLRPCVVFGERNMANMQNLIRQIHSGHFVLFGAGDNVKAAAYVGNLVPVILGLIETQQPVSISEGLRRTVESFLTSQPRLQAESDGGSQIACLRRHRPSLLS